MKQGRTSFLVRVGVSLGLLVLLFAFVDRAEFARRLGAADPGLLLLVVVIVTGDRLLMAWKWWLLVRGREAAVSLSKASPSAGSRLGYEMPGPLSLTTTNACLPPTPAWISSSPPWPSAWIPFSSIARKPSFRSRASP